MGLSQDEVRRRLREGGRNKGYQKSKEYKEAINYTKAHYKGVLRGSENLHNRKTGNKPRGGAGGVGGASSKQGCALWTCLVLVAFLGVPALIINLL